MRQTRCLLASVLTLLVLCVVPARAQTVITGNNGIYGQGSPGEAPAVLASQFSAGPGKVLTFTSVTGTVKYASSSPNVGPDGHSTGVGGTNFDSFNGLSGIKHDDRVMFLAGVFRNDALDGPVPARLDFSSSGISDAFTSLSPELNQVFFVGDGLTGTGTGSQQQFIIPGMATRLYLGFADAEFFTAPPGGPGTYFDNSGQLNANLQITDAPAVPEPSGLALLAGACCALPWLRVRRRSRRGNQVE